MRTPFTRNKKLSQILLAFMLLSILPLLKGQTSHTVDVTSNLYTPAHLVIQQGDTVIWTNSQGFHNVNGTQATYPDNPESFGNSTGRDWVFSHVFTLPGLYDYQCDPHVGLGMVGTLTVEASAMDTLFINFSGMTPHVGQTLWVLVDDEDSGAELARFSQTVEESFTVEIPGIMSGNAYEIDFFVDFNANGFYDAPPVDHAWRLEIEEASGNETLDFAHNTNFTDVEWEHRVILNLAGMGPHVGQEIYFALIESASGEIVDRISENVMEEFTVELGELQMGTAYHLDFFSDLNGNGYYDAPPADHAWRLEIPEAMGDDTLNFVHNTEFTDILWKHRLRVRFSGMNPHAGQMLTLYVRDLQGGEYLDTVMVEEIEESFDVKSYSLVPGESYMIDFYADHNGNGSYDAPPVDHAWRIETGEAMGDLDVDFSHNTDFTDIFEVTGISEDALARELYLYPNPVQDMLHIRSSHTLESIRIFSLSGVEILSLQNLGSQELSVSLKELQAGVYVADVTDSKGATQVVRILKQ